MEPLDGRLQSASRYFMCPTIEFSEEFVTGFNAPLSLDSDVCAAIARWVGTIYYAPDNTALLVEPVGDGVSPICAHRRFVALVENHCSNEPIIM